MVGKGLKLNCFINQSNHLFQATRPQKR